MNEPLDRLDALARLARQEGAPPVAFGPALADAFRIQRRDERVQAWLLSGALAAAAAVLLVCAPALLAGPDPLEAVFHAAYGAMP
ncbi:MAG: hypothetical protein KF886_18570 [Candidatus Hydrogenedentes bacterium]|nr:hypothetical protein [Candidatus Hydrogenedentota bacterium]